MIILEKMRPLVTIIAQHARCPRATDHRNIARPPGAWLVVSDLDATFHVARPAS
ncbi:hypothetical protein I545_4248 [Mycobacterium kansasii 662]|nr:hypothetical protein I545_4248 [Mycobacterium kansasii 662]